MWSITYIWNGAENPKINLNKFNVSDFPDGENYDIEDIPYCSTDITGSIIVNSDIIIYVTAKTCLITYVWLDGIENESIILPDDRTMFQGEVIQPFENEFYKYSRHFIEEDEDFYTVECEAFCTNIELNIKISEYLFNKLNNIGISLSNFDAELNSTEFNSPSPYQIVFEDDISNNIFPVSNFKISDLFKRKYNGENDNPDILPFLNMLDIEGDNINYEGGKIGSIKVRIKEKQLAVTPNGVISDIDFERYYVPILNDTREFFYNIFQSANFSNIDFCAEMATIRTFFETYNLIIERKTVDSLDNEIKYKIAIKK